MMDFGDVILYTFFPSFMTIQACTRILTQTTTAVHYLNVNMETARPQRRWSAQGAAAARGPHAPSLKATTNRLSRSNKQ